MRLVFLPLLAILITSATASAECERRYTYGIDYETRTVYVPAPGSKKGTIEFAYDVSTTVEFCSADSAYFCFLPYFAVPKRFDGSSKRWTVGGKTFEVFTSGGVVQAFGTRIDGIFSIQPSPQNPDRDKFERYYFSPRAGLVGIEWGRARAIYWLRDRTGFGASEPDPATLIWKKEGGSDRCSKD